MSCKSPSNKIKLALAALCSLMLACSAEIKTEGGAQPPPGPLKPQNKVQGPLLVGEWASECFSKMGNRSQTVALVIDANQGIFRQEKLFSDSACQTLEKESLWRGTFTFQEKRPSDVFTVEYRIDRSGGLTQITYENIKRQGDSLFISNYTIGDTVPTIELRLKSPAPTPAPTPTPAPF